MARSEAGHDSGRDVRRIGPVLVTGGTGRLGGLITTRLLSAGCPVRVLARRLPTADAAVDGVQYVAADLAEEGAGSGAFDGVETVVHCAGSAKGDEGKAQGVVRAAVRTGSPHVVFISVVGADRIPVVSAADRAMYGYFGEKLAAERVIERSGLPFTTLRATQFHDFVWESCRLLAKSPVVPVPRIHFQPVDAADVADRMTALALGPPAGLVAEMGGPRGFPFADLVRDHLRATGRRRLLLPLRQPGQAARAFREGANLTQSPAVGSRTWESYVEERTRR